MDKSPRERRHASVKQAIVDAARKIVVEQGIENLSMRALAEQIDYSPSALYKYFASKEEIIDEIRAEGFERMAAFALQKRADDLPPPQKLYQLAMAYLEFADTYPEHYLLMFSAPGRLNSIVEISEHPSFSTLIQTFQEGIASGYFELPEGHTAVSIAFQAWITLHGIVMLKLTNLRSLNSDFDALSKQIIQTQIDSFTVR